MTGLDLYTTSFATAVVVITAGIVFLLETVVRRESESGRFWAAAFLAGILTTICYVAWTLDRGLWIATAAGNSAFVAQMGLMWLGCRVYNRRVGLVPRLLVAAASVGALAAAGVRHDVGDWAGAVVMFLCLCAFAALGAYETLRGRLHTVFAAWGLTFALGAAALYYAARTVVFLGWGPESALFAEWFGTNVTSIVTISLTIIGVVSTSVLRVASALGPAYEHPRAAATADHLLPPDVFLPVLADVLARGERTGTPLAVIAFRVEGVDEIGAAFGQEAAERIEGTWRDAVHRHVPMSSGVGALDGSTVGVVLHAPTRGDAVSAANALRQHLLDDLVSVEGSVLPAIGVGFALTADHGYSAALLLDAAREAAGASADTTTIPVMQAPRGEVRRR